VGKDQGRPRKRWFDGVSQDLRTLDVEDWKDIVQDRERWKRLDGGGEDSWRVIKPRRRRRRIDIIPKFFLQIT
jgi:hypothetical protein